MSKIRTKVPVMVEVRDQKSYVVTIEITNWNYNVGQNYTTTVRDYIEPSNDPSNYLDPYMGTLKTKTKSYSIEALNNLFMELNTNIDITMNYTERMNSLLGKALLYITKSELDSNGKTIYGLLPDDWELVP